MTTPLPPPTRYGDIILWELPVQIAASFFIREGDGVLDVGGNTGGVAIAFSRLVGAPGRVVSFECNPKMIAWIEQDLRANGVTNVEIVTDAAHSVPDETLKFYLDESFYSSGSSLYRPAMGRPIEVKTTTVDLVCDRRGLRPKLIKIDVEGGEYDVLEGACRVISEHRPTIIFEYSGASPERNPIEYLWRLGYEMLDVNTYERVERGYFIQPFSTNVVAIPHDAGVWLKKTPIGASRVGSISIPAGVCVLENEVEFRGDGVGELECVDLRSGKRLALYHAEFNQLKHHGCSALVVSGPARGVAVRAKVMSGEGSVAVRASRVSAVEPVRG